MGHVNSNKKIKEVIQAFRAVPHLKENFCYVILGTVNDKSYKRELDQLISASSLEKTIFLIGSQPESILNTLIDRASVCINIRYPNTEGGSASIVEQMAFGKPTLVYNSGVFAEYPDDTVIKVDLNSDLSKVFQAILNHEIDLTAISIKAKEYAEKHFTASLYASKVCEFVQEIESHRTSLEFIDHVTSEIAQIGGGYKITPTIHHLSREISVLFPNL